MTTIERWLPPAVREAPENEPRLLDALLAAVDAQYDLLAADIDAVLDDLFIESCADWAVPYIGALLGLPADAERLEVAYAVALRRRKGTPAALEDFAEVVTGLPARVIEGWQVTAWVHQLGHPAPLHPAVLDLRDGSRLRVGTPFERTRRSVTPGGRWSPRAATVVVWPWQVATFVDTEAMALPEARRYALHPLGAQAPLYVRPRPLRLGSEATGAARTGDERDAPVRATYRVLQALAAPGDVTYGANLTLAATHPLAGTLLRLRVGVIEVPWSSLRFGSLPDGAAPAPPAAGEVVVDVVRGRVQLGTGAGTGPVRATWHRPVAGSMGALASTLDANPAARVVVTVDPDGTGPGVVGTLAQAFVTAQALSAGLDPAASRPGVPDVEIRLLTSDRLAAPPPQAFTPTVPRWRIVAPPMMTPTIVGDLALNLAGACVWLDGFFLAGALRLGAGLRGATLDGLTQDPRNGVDVAPDAWSLELTATRCLLGRIRADLAAFPISLTDCIVDGRRNLLRPCGDGAATSGPATDAVTKASRFGPALVAAGVTFAGAVRLESADAEDCVFADGVEVVQQQEGCLRHCYLGPSLSTPPRHPMTYRCGPFAPPTFVSEGFEAAGYYALALDPPQPLLEAASDGGEVGAYHHVRRAARLRRLRQRVDEFVPLGLRSAVAVAPWEE
jgi:hypothetical protein